MSNVLTKVDPFQLFLRLRNLDLGDRALLRNQIRVPLYRQNARAQMLQHQIFQELGASRDQEELLSRICTHYCQYSRADESLPAVTPFGVTLTKIVDAQNTDSLREKVSTICNLSQARQHVLFWSFLGQFLSIAKSKDVKVHWPTLFSDLLIWDHKLPNTSSAQRWVRDYAIGTTSKTKGTDLSKDAPNEDDSAEPEEQENSNAD